jgi:hypothetical protein
MSINAMRLTALVLAAGLLWPVSALAQNDVSGFLTGNGLYQNCTSSNDLDKAICLGYVMGVTEGLQSRHTTCVPKGAGVSGGQIMDVVTNYLRDHPEARHYAAFSEVELALKKAFPCK